MAANQSRWGGSGEPYARSSTRSSACTGKMDTGFAIRKSAKPVNLERIPIRPHRMRSRRGAALSGKLEQPRHRLHVVAAGEDGRRERLVVEPQVVLEHALHDGAQIGRG